jgi:hypothetical protein
MSEGRDKVELVMDCATSITVAALQAGKPNPSVPGLYSLIGDGFKKLTEKLGAAYDSLEKGE